MFKKINFLAITIGMLLVLFACDKKPESELIRSYETFYNFSTLLELSIWDENEVPEEHWQQIKAIIQHIEYTFTRNDINSELYLLNQYAGNDEPFTASDDLFYVVKTALEYAKLTEGKFEPAIGPLLDLWGDIGEIERPPSVEEFAQIADLVDYQLIELDEENKTIHLPKKGMSIDLGAISKGYAADLLTELIKDLGYKHAMIDLGTSSIQLIGERHSENKAGQRTWVVGVRNPELSGNLLIVRLVDESISSSATDQRFWFVRDKSTKKITEQYHHILDPDTGYPVDNEILQVTIIAKSAMIGDALSTSLFTVGLDKSFEIINSLEDVEAIILTTNKKVYMTPGLKDKVELLQDQYELIIKE